MAIVNFIKRKNPSLYNHIIEDPFLHSTALKILKYLYCIGHPVLTLIKIKYKILLKKCGRNVEFERRMMFHYPENISIGDGCSFSSFVVLDAHDSITIGNNCMFALKSNIVTITHDYMRYPMSRSIIKKPFIIGNDVWVGVGATVLPGIKIGDGAVIGAHALVTKDVPSKAIVVGVPARIMKYRD